MNCCTKCACTGDCGKKELDCHNPSCDCHKEKEHMNCCIDCRRDAEGVGNYTAGCYNPQCPCHKRKECMKCCDKCSHEEYDKLFEIVHKVCDNPSCECHKGIQERWKEKLGEMTKRGFKVPELIAFIEREITLARDEGIQQADREGAYISGVEVGKNAMRQEVIEMIEKKKRILWHEEPQQHIRNIQNNETLEDLLTSLTEKK